MAARLTGTGMALLLALASPALAQESAPNVVEGHPTNAFMPGFPETIDGLVRESIQSKPAEGRIVANYRAPDDNRGSCRCCSTVSTTATSPGTSNVPKPTWRTARSL